MSQPINLNKARKAADKAGKKKHADANAVKFGRSKTEQQAEAARNARADSHLDRHRLTGRDPKG